MVFFLRFFIYFLFFFFLRTNEVDLKLLTLDFYMGLKSQRYKLIISRVEPQRIFGGIYAIPTYDILTPLIYNPTRHEKERPYSVLVLLLSIEC